MISKLAERIKPYVYGEQPRGNFVKLNTNENLFCPSIKVAETVRNFDTGKLKLYPDPECSELRAALAKTYGVRYENIFVGNGSDEILAFAFAALFDKDNYDVFFADTTYSFYPVYCNLWGIPYRTMPLNKKFEIDYKDYIGKQTAGIVICNPNAPTGILLGVKEISKILAENPTKAVIIDEAYVDFAKENCLSLLSKHDNLLIVRTFSKSFSLAGLRVGFAFGSKKIIEALNKIKNCFNSYTVGSLAQAAAIAALSDAMQHKRSIDEIIRIRDQFRLEIDTLGFNVLPSDANFVFASYSGVEGCDLYERLRQKNVLVRHFNAPKISDYIRITIGSEKDMDTCKLKLWEAVKGK
jgi:histidinol-phosphate aminotransferase